VRPIDGSGLAQVSLDAGGSLALSTVTIIGLGTVGSALSPLVARMPEVSQITLVDPDDYDESNLTSQAIDTAALGKPKVAVQASLIHAINPDVRVAPILARVENVPLARVDSSVLVSCVDNRCARQAINRIAWRCAKPWVDAALDAASLVRLNAYQPGESKPCMECAWDQSSYDLLDQEYPCAGGDRSISQTAAPAELGTLAATLQAAELRRLLGNGGADSSTLIGAQFMFDTSSHTGHFSRFSFNEQCRFDHQVWRDIEATALPPNESTLADLFDALAGTEDCTVSLDGHVVSTCVDCVACGKRSSVGLVLSGRLSAEHRTCACGGRMFAPGFFSMAALHRSDISAKNLDLTLASLGIRSGDVLSIASGPDHVRHVEIAERVLDE